MIYIDQLKIGVQIIYIWISIYPCIYNVRERYYHMKALDDIQNKCHVNDGNMWDGQTLIVLSIHCNIYSVVKIG